MNDQHTTAGWERALMAALASAVGSPKLVEAGRRLLAAGTAKPPNVNAGFATTKFPLEDGRVARPRLVVRELTAEQWARVEDVIAARPDAAQVAGTAAISDQLTDPAHTDNIPLVPSAQELSFTCTCTPGAAVPCVHSVAVGLLLARRLRTAPSPLFTLRGRPHQYLKDRLRGKQDHAQHAPAPPASPVLPSPRPPEVTPAPAPLPAPVQSHLPVEPLPEPVDLDLALAVPALTGQLPPTPPSLPSLEALETLVADAAHRAAGLMEGNDVACPDTGSDLARFVTLPHGAPFRQDVMDHLGLGIVGLGHLQLAYEYGGGAGAAAYLDSFSVSHDVLARAQADIQPLRPAPLAVIMSEDNRLTDEAAGVQLRYGPDGRWHPYRSPYGTWQPVPGPSHEPGRAYRSARAAARTERRTK